MVESRVPSNKVERHAVEISGETDGEQDDDRSQIKRSKIEGTSSKIGEERERKHPDLQHM